MNDLPNGEVYEFGDFQLERSSGRLLRRGKSGDLTQVVIGSRALALLDALIAHAPELVTRRDIMDAVWPGTAVEESNLSVQLSALRRALDDGHTGSSAIQTISGRGYRLTLPVTRLEPMPSPDSPSPVNAVSRTSAITGKRMVGPRAAAACLLLALAGWGVLRSGWLVRSGVVHTSPALSIVVLPFASLNHDPDQAYFVDAITSNLTTDLSRIAGIAVIAYSTAATYRDKQADTRQVGYELGVAYVLEGSVRRVPESVEVNARLVDAQSGTLIWADRFDTTFHDLPRTEAEITGRLAFSLNSQLVTAAARAGDASNVAPEASELIMRGWAAWYRPFSIANRKEAQEEFERALEKAPESIDARIGLGTILMTNIGTGLSRDANADAAQVERLIREALEVDPNSSPAHTVLGTLRRWQNRLDEARAEQETAVALDRNNAHALLQLGQALMFLGKPAAAIPFVEAANSLNPRDPNAAWSDWTLGVCQLLLGDTETATRLLRQARNRNPRVYYFQLYLAGALGLRGDIDEARAAFSEAARLNPSAASFTGWRTVQPWITNPAYWGMIEKTAAIGLRKAGMPD